MRGKEGAWGGDLNKTTTKQALLSKQATSILFPQGVQEKG
jgi:hypothetical protein